MSTRSSKFLIGLFVIIGMTILAVIIIWVGASRILMKGSLYAAYFDESVQGLQVDSAIKYRGVEIGKVQSIGVAPDYRLIEVIMKIDLEGDLQNQTIASLKTAGITGIVFIELDRLSAGELANSPKLIFQPNYPVIPSRRSEISRFLADTSFIMQNIKDIDFKGISDQLKNTTHAIGNFLEGKRINNIMANLESTSKNLDQAIAKINKTVAEGKVDRVVNEALVTLSEARQLIGQARSEINGLNLREKAERTDAILKDIDKKTKTITSNLQDTSENLRATSENLQKLSDSLNRDPSDLIFTKPAPTRKAME
ncbi:MAG: putative ABC transport system substrate-binding protein [Syntrophaceae bacterium]|nr:MAG: putative ABC transport system substrate-binding protein [Syntrophaceae bacterium]